MQQVLEFAAEVNLDDVIRRKVAPAVLAAKNCACACVYHSMKVLKTLYAINYVNIYWTRFRWMRKSAFLSSIPYYH